MKRITNLFGLVILFLIFFTRLNSVSAQGFAPQPGITCGKGLDTATKGNYKPGDINYTEYSCCYSVMENFLTINTDFADKLPALLKAPILGLFTLIQYQIDRWPLGGTFPGTEKFLPNLGNLKEGMKSYMGKNRCVEGASAIGTIGTDSCYCKLGSSPALAALKPLCENIPGPEKSRCFQCIGYNPSKPSQLGEGGVWTALGCIRTTSSQFITETVMGLGISLAGVIAFICIIYSAFMLQTSSGNPERIKKSQEMLTSCIMGLILIIFSIFILRVIGVDILRIPGFR